MSRIILHVGHGKTGTSALQSSFALSIDALADAGIHYPDHRDLVNAAEGKITSGNIVAKSLLKTASAALASKDRAVLFSNEMLFHDIVTDENLLVNLMKVGVPVTVVLYIRNPLQHVISLYGQMVKRSGYTGSLGDFLPEYRFPGAVIRFIKNAKAAGVDLRVLNYSNHQDDILGSFADAIGISRSVLNVPPVARINRSLTVAEAYVQQRFNAEIGQTSAKFVSDPLCNLLPDVPSEMPLLRPLDYKKFAKRNGALLDKANTYLPVSEKYNLEPYVQSDFGEARRPKVVFTRPQIDVLVTALSSRIVDASQDNVLRNFVISAQSGDRIGSADIAMLTDLALKLRLDDVHLRAKKDALLNGGDFKPTRMFLVRELVKQILRRQ